MYDEDFFRANPDVVVLMATTTEHTAEQTMATIEQTPIEHTAIDLLVRDETALRNLFARHRYDMTLLVELGHDMRAADDEDAPHPVPVDDVLPAIPWDLPIVQGPPPGVIMTQGQQVEVNGVMVSYSEVIFLWTHGPAQPPRQPATFDLPVAEEDTHPNQVQYWLCWWRPRPHRHWVCEQLREVEAETPRRNWRVVYWWSECDRRWMKFRRPQRARA